MTLPKVTREMPVTLLPESVAVSITPAATTATPVAKAFTATPCWERQLIARPAHAQMMGLVTKPILFPKALSITSRLV